MNTPDNSDARSRLVISALRLFAEKGYKAASTREICDAAGANISAIRYYFGDKASLYRAAFIEPSDLHRLAFSLIGMAVYFYVGQDVVSSISPQLLSSAKHIDALAERLAGFAMAMIESEKARRS
jgi:AcrR family transcriptional regulator